VTEDQLDSVWVDTAFCQQRSTAMLQTVNVTHGIGDRRLAPDHSRLRRKFAVRSEQSIDLPLAERSAFLAYEEEV
jgi:hypothetical protein